MSFISERFAFLSVSIYGVLSFALTYLRGADFMLMSAAACILLVLVLALGQSGRFRRSRRGYVQTGIIGSFTLLEWLVMLGLFIANTMAIALAFT